MGSSPHLVVGIDGGGTKTECAALSLADGRHCCIRGPGSNYQGIGIRRAEEVWKGLLDQCLAALHAAREDLAAVGFGVAGWDRPKDETVIRGAFDRLFGNTPREFVNDTHLILRAGTRDGLGVAVVSGTGCNAVGAAPGGRRFRVGGLGPDFGDVGSAADIGAEALRRAFRSLDDRGPTTRIAELIVERLGLERLDDLVDLFIADARAEAAAQAFHVGLLAPLVFEAAAQGDEVAIAVLEWAGREVALSARAVARNLFSQTDSFPVVMGGSVFQAGRTDHMRQAFVVDVNREFPNARPVVLASKPVVGAVLYALDLALAGRNASERERHGRTAMEVLG
jgi:N-acetylglucosamine kinase-like BadF-type ATPase